MVFKLFLFYFMLISSLLILLLSIAVTLRRDKSILYSRSCINILWIVLIISLTTFNINVISTGISLYGGLFHINSIGQLFHNIVYLISIIIILLTSFFARKSTQSITNNIDSIYISKYSETNKFTEFNDITTDFNKNEFNKDFKNLYLNTIINKKSENFKILEYPLILLFVITGATFLISSSDIVSIFLSIELQSYGLYLLATLYRNSELSTGAGLTYFLLGGMSSCFILLGTALLYTNSGVTNLEGFYIINNIWDITNYDTVSAFQNSYINYSLIIMTVGFLFKVSAAPFHFWSPDVYDAIPTIVTTFVAIVAKLSILVFLFEIVHYTSNAGFNGNFDWRYILLLSSLLSLIIGTVLGLNQFRIKRLYAYSTISHLGFILLSLSINTVESVQAFIFYLIQYSVSNLNAFLILISVGFSLYIYKNEKIQSELLLDKNNSPIQLINQLKGYFYINPILALSLVITLYSFVGVPPLLGFFGKQMVLSAAMDNGLVFISLVAILCSVISAVYYLNIIKNIFFEKSDYYLYEPHKTIIEKGEINISIFSAFSISISIITLLIIAFLLLQQDVLNITSLVSIYILNI